jgi:tetratricopeptide (TPR) repeat protein
VLPILIALEQSLGRDEQWAEVSECLARRATLSKSVEEVATIEAKRRWILSEKLAGSEEAWDFYRKLHEERPEDREVLEALARIAGARGETGLAIQFLDGLSNIAGTPEEAARYQRRVAEVHLSSGTPDKAREAFLRALDHKDDDTEAIDGLESLAREAEDWHGLVGVLARRAPTVDGRAQVELHREVARIWETQLEDDAVAVDAWKKVLEMVPEDPDALAHLVGLSRRCSQWTALVEYGAAYGPHQSAAERSELWCELGQVALEHLNREDQAISFLSRASSGEVLSMEAAQILERIHTRRGDWPQVVEALMRQARASEGEEAAALYLKAARTRRDALHDLRGASEIYDQVLHAAPNNPEALRYRGDHLFNEGRFTDAAEVYARLETGASDLDLDDFDVQMEQALLFFRFGECLRQDGQPEAALERYKQALDLNRSHLPTLEAVGPLYIDLSRWPEAADVFKHILQLTSGQGDSARLARVYTNLGRVEYAQGNEAKALKRFNKALELVDNDVQALAGYARILFDREDWNSLLNVYNSIIYHAQEPAEVIEAYLVKGFVLDAKMSLPDKAAQHYEKSLAFDPAQPVALLRLAELALRKQDWGQATSLADRALGLTQVERAAAVESNLQLVKLIVGLGTEDGDVVSEAAAAAVAADGSLEAAVGADIGGQEPMHDLLRERLQAHL